MPLNRIDKPQWQPFFDRVSKALGAKSVDIDIIAPTIHDQAEARHLALTGLSYDSKGDLFAVIGEELEHNIAHPREIRVDATLDSVREIDVIDQAGVHHRLRLVDPLLLPPA
jgi:Family of unknown function (DUF5335)